MIYKKFNKTAFSLIELSIVVLIIGILIAGISQSSRLIKAMKLSTARSLTRSSDVNSINNLTAWFDATAEGVLSSSCDTVVNGVASTFSTSLATTPRTEGNVAKRTINYNQPEHRDIVRLWKDSSPQNTESAKIILEYTEPYSGSTGTCSTTAFPDSNNGPMYHNSAINGLPAIYFQERSAPIPLMRANYLTSLDKENMPIKSGKKQFSIFLVFRNDKLIGWPGIFQISSNNFPSDDDRTTLTMYPSWGGCGTSPSLSWNMGSGRGNCSSAIYFSDPNKYNLSNSLSGVYAAGFAIDYENLNNNKLYLNSSNNPTSTSGSNITASNSLNLNASQLAIGGGYAFNGTQHSLPFPGYVSEVIIFDRTLIKEEASSVMNYLIKKYNIKEL